ncbi:alpha/beta fold hydrolase [Allomesorhizobium camelthorni]|uniref:Alpha/beta fold hydrolase n=1 Tax=Allomesorhizobium camelthorni TaxID=475069 RepID=A0A6G4WKF9_9HYPH|nr:alpha/beta fold hydrolase [Mesorhizobium camelthorni]NGO54838.1 alpha/beta fold hydrolase [Mesorhizobium camelthorni]
MDIEEWLRGLGLQQYVTAFRENNVEADVLLRLTAEDLKDIGVSSVGHRRKLMVAITELRDRSSPTPVGNANAFLQVARHASAVASHPDAERRQLTVMFSDLVGSTALSACLDPEEMREIIRGYQNCCAGEIARFGGYVANFMGDGVLAYFGWPRAHEDDAERAVRAGLAVTRAVAELPTPKGNCLAAHVGIATGLVVVGDLAGPGPSQEHAIIGETPNLAARLQGCAGPGEVLVAEDTRRLVGQLFAFCERGDLVLKGFDAPVRAYSIVGSGAIESRFDALHGLKLAPLIGRERELAILLDAWAGLADGQGRVVLLIGEPGIGKSRLIEALKSRLAATPHACLEYQASPLHAHTALHPFANELARTAEFHGGDGPRVRRQKLNALLTQRLEAKADAATPVLATLLALPTKGDLSPDLTPQQVKAKTLAILMTQVETLAHREPLLLVFEDVHWADPTSLELLAALAELAASLPILMIVSHRPEFTAFWSDLPHALSMTLDRLNRRDAVALAKQTAGPGRLQPAAIQRIVSRSDGVPLFIEELARVVLETGPRGEAEPGLAEMSWISHREIPSTLSGLLSARLDRLGSAKEVLQVGAAIGREFSRDLAIAVLQGEGDPADEALERAVATGLIVREGAGPLMTFRFRHALIQEAAYGSMLKSRRRSLHARIAHLAETQTSDFRAPPPEWLARHYAEAGEMDRAASLWFEAACQAKATFATREAASHLAACLAATRSIAGDTEPPPETRRIRTDALVMLGDLASLAEDIAEADDQYRQAIDEAPDPATRERIEKKRHHCRIASRGSARIAYYEHGAGDTTLLFVSTQALGLAMFQPILERLCDDFRVVTVDPRGSGRSDALQRPYTIAEHASDALAVIRELAAPRLIGVGISMGANVLFHAVHQAPGLLSGVVTIGAPPAGQGQEHFSGEWRALQAEMKHTGEIEPMLRLHVGQVFSEPEMRGDSGTNCWRAVVARVTALRCNFATGPTRTKGRIGVDCCLSRFSRRSLAARGAN